MRIPIAIIILVLLPLHLAFGEEIDLLKKIPSNLDPFFGRKLQKFEDLWFGASAGYSYSFESKNAQLTIILFDAGRGPIEDGLKSDVTNIAFEQAISDINYYEQKKIYKNVQVIDKSTKTLDNKINVLFAHLKYEIDTTGNFDYSEVESFLLMTGIQGYMLKIRLTKNLEDMDKEYILKLTRNVINSINF